MVTSRLLAPHRAPSYIEVHHERPPTATARYEGAKRRVPLATPTRTASGHCQEGPEPTSLMNLRAPPPCLCQLEPQPRRQTASATPQPRAVLLPHPLAPRPLHLSIIFSIISMVTSIGLIFEAQATSHALSKPYHFPYINSNAPARNPRSPGVPLLLLSAFSVPSARRTQTLEGAFLRSGARLR